MSKRVLRRGPRPRRRSTNGRRRLVRATTWAVFVVVWWLFAAPTAVGGPLAIGLVTGTSMTPTFATGDLIVTHRRSAYHVGDVVAAEVGGGLVIHRIVGGSGTAGWRTKGDHLEVWDAWTIEDGDIRGEAWVVIPGGAAPITWATRHPVAAAVVVTAIVGLGTHRRRRGDRRLTEMAAVAGREVPVDQIGLGWFAALAVAFVATVAAQAATVGTFAAHHDLSPQLLASLASFLVAGGFTVWVAHRVFDGAGLPEPRRSLRQLAGQPLLAVGELPAWADDAEPVGGSALRSVAERARVPVLHQTSLDGRVHTFVVATPSRTVIRTVRVEPET